MNGLHSDEQAHLRNGSPVHAPPQAPVHLNPVATSSTLDTATILQALEVIYDLNIDNGTRQKASTYLEKQKNASDASHHGFLLASDYNQTPLVRHFGLSLLEHAIQHKWHALSQQQSHQLTQWTLNLATGSLRPNEPQYIRNKIAQLWVDLAKKSWALEWLDMDANLVALWGRDFTSTEFVLTILENLSEDVFTREVSAAALRGQDLNSALVEIFTPASHFSGALTIGNQKIVLRSGQEGWLSRISHFLRDCLQDSVSYQDVKVCMRKGLSTLRSAFTWVVPSAIVSTRCLESICGILSVQDADVLMAAIEALQTLYDRSHFEENEFQALVLPMYRADNVALLRKLYEWSVVDVRDVDSPKYPISQKFSETVSCIANFIDGKLASQSLNIDLSSFFHFMTTIVAHQSLMVSIPVLDSWIKLLESRHVWKLDAVMACIGPLLEVASQRIIRYEQLPDDSEEPAVVFAMEDIESAAERHAFFSLYRRFCHRAIQNITSKRPQEAISHILAQADTNLDALGRLDLSFDPSTYAKGSPNAIQVDAQFALIDAALVGYSMWLTDHGKRPQSDEQHRIALESHMEDWASNMLSKRKFSDPVVKHRVIKTAVEFSNRALEKNESFALKVLEHILMSQMPDHPEFPSYSEAVKELHVYAALELRRLAVRHADYFATFYEQLESKIHEIRASINLGEKAQAELPAILLIIMQWASNVQPILRQTRLQSFAEPIRRAWQDPQLSQSLSSFEQFSKLLGLEKVGPYLRSRHANLGADWSAISLDGHGLAIQSEMDSNFAELPLRITKSTLCVSVEKITPDTSPYEVACEIWAPVIPAIIPNLLHLISYAHRMHDPGSWPGLPSEMQGVVVQVLQDRFWQAGISDCSREDFYTRISSTKDSLEGFASSVRGKIRTMREATYNILFSMSRLGQHFYGYKELPEPLSQSLFGTAGFLSAHNFSMLLNISKFLIYECPSTDRSHFLPPMLSSLFTQMDQKCSKLWKDTDDRSVTSTGNGNFTQEMKEESILRQLTYNAVSIIMSLLDPQRDEPKKSSKIRQPDHIDLQSVTSFSPRSLRIFILSSPQILEPLLLFCTHALCFRDTRSAGIMVRILRSVVPHFSYPTSTNEDATASLIREFIAENILKAAITSLNDGYFADLQKDLANLIATIWTCYGLPTHVPPIEGQPAFDRPALSQTPQKLILSLSGMTEQRVNAAAKQLLDEAGGGGATGNHRQQRAVILGLLEGFRGVRISELGKMDTGRQKDKLREKYASRESAGRQDLQENVARVVDIDDEGDTLGLGGVQELFG